MVSGKLGLSICMLVSNDISRDQRVWQEAKSLVDQGYQVTVIARLSDSTKKEETVSNVRIIRLTPRLASWIVDLGKIMPRRRSQRASSASENAVVELDEGCGERRKIRTSLLDVLRDCALTSVILLRMVPFALAARRIKADLYHAHDLDMLPAAFLASHHQAKLVYDSHELWTEMGGHTWLFKLFWRKVEARLISRCDAVITVSESIARELSIRYKITSPAVLRNCPAVSRGGKLHVGSMDLERLFEGFAPRAPLNSGRPVRFLYQGAFIPMRGLEQLVKAFKYTRSDAILLLQGFGSTETCLRALVVRHKLGKKVCFLPPVEMGGVVAAARMADVGVVPFLPTTLNNKLALPNKVFGYMAAGLALYVSDIPELARLVQELENGVAFDPFIPRGVADGIDYLAKQPCLLERMKERSKSAATDRYNWEAEQWILLNVYRRLEGL